MVQTWSAQPLDDREDALGGRVGREVDVTRRPAEEDIPDRPADEGELMPGCGEELAELVGERRDGGEQHGSGSLPLGQRIWIWHGHRE